MPTRDDYSGLLGRFYSFYIAHPRLGRPLGRLIWASDFTPLYRSLASLQSLDAALVVDVACGAGLALRWLEPTRVGRYAGIDSSPAMLHRARGVARRRGFVDAELELADVAAIPVPDGAADMCLMYNGLHCFDQPQAAIAEAVRCLAPDGRMIGSMLVRGGSSRVDRMMAREAAKQRTTMAEGGTERDLAQWLKEAGFDQVEIQTAGCLAVFSAHR